MTTQRTLKDTSNSKKVYKKPFKNGFLTNF